MLVHGVRQIKGLDAELVKYRNALKKAKGPAAANIKKRAMETLKRKKMYEQQRDQMAGQQFNIEQTSFAIDSIKDTATTVNTQCAMASRRRELSQVTHQTIHFFLAFGNSSS